MNNLRTDGMPKKKSMSRSCYCSGWFAVASTASVALAGPACAADWHWDPRIEVGGVYNDNFRLTGNDKISVTGAELDAALQISALTPTTEFRLVPRIRSEFFPSDHDQNLNDQFLTADYIYHGQRWLGDLNASFARQSVLSSELPSSSLAPGGLGTVVGGDTGFVNVRSRRDDAHVAPNATLQLSQRYKLQLGAAYDDVTYQPSFAGSYVDFKNYSALVGLGYDVSQRSTVYLNAVGLRYEPKTSVNQDSDSYGARVEWWYHTSQTLHGYLRGGLDRTDSNNTTTTSSRQRSTNYVFGAGLTGLYQVTAFYFDVSRAVVPSGAGGLITRDQLQLRVRRSFSPRYSAFVQAYGTNDSGAQTGSEFLDRRYVTGAVGLEWRFLREFSVRGQYGYRWQKYGNSPSGASGNEFIVSLVYEPHRPEGDLTLGYYAPTVY
jgi:hypothetical protein